MNATKSTGPAVVTFGDRIFRIEESEPIYGPRGGHLGKQSIYWGDAYSTEEQARRAIRIVKAGGSNPKPSVRVSINTGEVLKESH